MFLNEYIKFIVINNLYMRHGKGLLSTLCFVLFKLTPLRFSTLCSPSLLWDYIHDCGRVPDESLVPLAYLQDELATTFNSF